MAHLSATATVLLTLLVVGVAHCRVTDGEVVGQPGASSPPSDPEEAAVLSDAADGASYSYHNDGAGREYVRVDSAAGTSIYFLNGAAAGDGEGVVRPVDMDGNGRQRRQPCRHGHRQHMWWARRHGLLRHGEGFHGKRVVAEMPVEPATHGAGEERREGEVVLPLPVAEPDPDSRPEDAAVSLQGVQKTELHGEEAWRRFHHGRGFHHRHHHPHDEHEEEDEHDNGQAAEEASPMKRFRFHHHHHHDKEDESDDEDELEKMARRLVRKALMKGRMPHHGRRHFHYHLRFRHHITEDAAAAAAGEEEEKGGVVKWIKDFVNQF